MITLTGKRVEARSDRRVLLDVDGEQPGKLPVVIEMVPQALTPDFGRGLNLVERFLINISIFPLVNWQSHWSVSGFGCQKSEKLSLKPEH